MIFINFKTYETGTGEKALEMVKTLESVSRETGVKLIPIVQALDLRMIAGQTSLEVWVQGIDNITYGAHTGHTLPEGVLLAGAKGAVLNHSENKALNVEDLAGRNQRARDVGLKTLIFADSTDELRQAISLKPDFVSYEPPELIGSSDKSVATEKPDIVKKAVNIAKNADIPLIVGAGIQTKEDITTSLNLGASGFAIASGIMNAENPRTVIENLAKGFK